MESIAYHSEWENLILDIRVQKPIIVEHTINKKRKENKIMAERAHGLNEREMELVKLISEEV